MRRRSLHADEAGARLDIISRMLKQLLKFLRSLIMALVALGVVGVDRDCLRLAERVNECKAALREVCAPLQRVRRRVPVKGGGTESIPVVRAMLRSIQRSEVNLLAAYRRLPILGAPPQSIA